MARMASRSVVGTRLTASTGSPASPKARCHRETRAWLERKASFPPLRSMAFPAFKATETASTVAPGRAS